MTSDLQTLIGKLNPSCRKGLESAAEICVSQTHYNVELEHYLLALADQPDTDMQAVFRYYEVRVADVKDELSRFIENFRRGNSRTPALSPYILRLLEQAWIISSLHFNSGSIRSGAILLALLDQDNLRILTYESCPALKRISADALKTDIREIARSSCEESPGVPDENKSSRVETPDSKTPNLDQYTTDMTLQARKGLIDPIYGRDAEIRQLIDILTRRRQNNPILTGDAGVGKTAVAEGFALRVAQGNVPPSLKNISIRLLDLALLQAGAGIKGEFERRLKSVIDEVKQSVRPIILFIDEAHTLIGAGGTAGMGDAANLLKPALARGELRTIAATTWSEYKKYFEKDPALARRFQVIKIEEPDEETAVKMLGSVVGNLESHHKVKISEEAVRDAVRLSHRYISGRLLPDKAISVLDTACARTAIAHGEQIKRPCVNSYVVAEVISGWTGIPVGKMLTNDIETVLNLKEKLEERIIGQSEALDTITRRIQTYRANLDDPGKPVGVFLLAGQSGVGKTETAVALSDILYGGDRNMIVINMSEYQESYTVSGLKGSPPGYTGYGKGGVLTEAVRHRPYSVVLLDEAEKAHPDVMELFYQVFDKGRLDDAEGVVVDFRNTMILLTTNAGADRVSESCCNPRKLPDAQMLSEIIKPELLRHFKPALLGRLVIVPYYPLSDEAIHRIVRLKMRKIQQRFLENHRINLTYSDDLLMVIASRCMESDAGARGIDQLLTHSLLPELSGELLRRMALGKNTTAIHVCSEKKQRFAYRFYSPEDEIPEAESQNFGTPSFLSESEENQTTEDNDSQNPKPFSWFRQLWGRS
jgi:ATP-dependent Clp protease ATP-binding subunit ClpC